MRGNCGVVGPGNWRGARNPTAGRLTMVSSLVSSRPFVSLSYCFFFFAHDESFLAGFISVLPKFGRALQLVFDSLQMRTLGERERH